MLHATERFFDDFLGAQIVQATNVGGPWAKVDVSSAGSPTLQGVASEVGGAIKALCDNTSEEQSLTLYFADILAFKWDNILSCSFRMKASAITTNELVVCGLASATNATEDTVAYNAWFRLDGGLSVLVETDDNTTNDDDNDTGIDIVAATYKEYTIDFSNGLSDVRFFCTDGNGDFRRVLAKTTFTMAGATGTYCQPFFRLHKASGTTEPYAALDWFEVAYKR